MGRVDTLDSFLTLKEIGFSFSLFSIINIDYRLAFIMLRYIPFIPIFFGAFIVKWC
jgi:hypothetical protein